MDSVLPDPVSPPAELLLLFLRCPRRGERGSRGERPGLPDTDPLPLDPTTSSFETERELPYMVNYVVCTVETKACLVQMNKSSESKIHAENYTKTQISESKKLRMDALKKNLEP